MKYLQLLSTILLYSALIIALLNLKENKATKVSKNQMSFEKLNKNYFDVEYNLKYYIEHRLRSQQKWHSNKSKSFKKKYNCIKTIEIILIVSIPVVSLINFNIKFNKIAVSIIGSVLTFLNYYLEHKKYHELWIEYRKVSELLKREEELFRAKAGVYNCDLEKSYKVLVENVESILGTQNNLWQSVVQKECDIKHN